MFDEDLRAVAEAASADESCVGLHSNGSYIATLHDCSMFRQLPQKLTERFGEPCWMSPQDPNDPLWSGQGQPSSICSCQRGRGWTGWTAYTKVSYSSSLGLEGIAEDSGDTEDDEDDDGPLPGAFGCFSEGFVLVCRNRLDLKASCFWKGQILCLPQANAGV